MEVKNPLYLKKIIVHYQDRINKLRSDNNFEIHTKLANGFIDEILKSIPNLVNTLGSVDKVIRIDKTKFPDYRNITCMALDQYIKDLNADWNTLENRLAHNPSYLKQIKEEIEITDAIKKDCSCNS
jgi:glutaredoxin 2